MEKKIILQRLALIKYLYNSGNEQLHKPEPLYCSALLSFHDATEMFLVLVAENYGVNPDDTKFMEYWDKLRPKLVAANKQDLTQKESMRTMNKARVSLKHYGIIPSKSDLEKYNILSNAFFDENCKNIFDVNTIDISLIELVNYEKTKKNLAKANECYQKKDFPSAIKHLSIAFEQLTHEYEDKKKDKYGTSPFLGERDLKIIHSIDKSIAGLESVGEFAEDITRAIASVHKVVRLIGFGIDYKRYARFSMNVPEAMWLSTGSEAVADVPKDAKITKEEFEFCLNFVIESALKLQEFDFESAEEPLQAGLGDFF